MNIRHSAVASLLYVASGTVLAALASPTIFTIAPNDIGTSSGSSWVRASDDNSTKAFSQITMQYQFRVNAPIVTVVPLNFDYFLQAFGAVSSNIPISSPDFARATVSSVAEFTILTLPGTQLFDKTARYSVNGIQVATNTNTGIVNRQSLNLNSNQIYFIRLSAIVNAEGFDSNGRMVTGYSGSGYAFADPFVSVDSAFSSAHPDFSLEFSPGIDNVVTTAVPEPDNWLLMCLGVGVLFPLCRCERKRNA